MEGFDYASQRRPDQFWPRLLPDGKHFTFVDTSDGQPRLTIGSLESDKRTPIGISGSKAEFSPSGHLLFVRDGRIFARRFDVDSLTLLGEPQMVVDDIMFFAPIGSAPFSVSDNGTLVYRRRVGDATLPCSISVTGSRSHLLLTLSSLVS